VALENDLHVPANTNPPCSFGNLANFPSTHVPMAAITAYGVPEYLTAAAISDEIALTSAHNHSETSFRAWTTSLPSAQSIGSLGGTVFDQEDSSPADIDGILGTLAISTRGPRYSEFLKPSLSQMT
jgi:hypothetical protein